MLVGGGGLVVGVVIVIYVLCFGLLLFVVELVGVDDVVCLLVVDDWVEGVVFDMFCDGLCVLVGVFNLYVLCEYVVFVIIVFDVEIIVVMWLIWCELKLVVEVFLVMVLVVVLKVCDCFVG